MEWVNTEILRVCGGPVLERASSAKRRAEPTVMPDGGKRVDDDVESVSTASDLSPSEWSVVLGESRSGQPIALGEEAIPLRPLDNPATFPADHEQPFQYLPLRRLAAFFSRPSVRGVAILAGSVLGLLLFIALLPWLAGSSGPEPAPPMGPSNVVPLRPAPPTPSAPAASPSH